MENKENMESTVVNDSVVAVVPEEPAPNVEEAIAVDSNGRVDPISLEYNEYRNKIIQTYGSSTENDSIIASFNVHEDVCDHTLTIRFSDSNFSKVQKKGFSYNENFKDNFLIPLVNDFNQRNKVFDSSIEVTEDNKCNFIARTSLNDSLCISNIDIEFANKLRDLLPKQELDTSKPKQLVKLDNKGIGNYLVIFLTVVLIGMTLAGTIFFTIASR